MPPIANCGEMTAPDVIFGAVAWFPQGFAGCARDVDTSDTVSNIAASVVSFTEFIASSLTWSLTSAKQKMRQPAFCSGCAESLCGFGLFSMLWHCE
jgi:hypothetical protein